MRHLFTLILGGATCLLAAAQTSTQTRTGSASNTSDHAFLRKAAQADLAEIQLGKLAEKNASNPVVKQFGQRMVTDHTNLLEQTKTMAASKGVNLPTSPSAKDEATYRSLEGKTGTAFDNAYISDMINDHTKDIAAFEHESNSGPDADIRGLASKALPVLQEHLHLAENAARQLGISTTPSGGDLR